MHREGVVWVLRWMLQSGEHSVRFELPRQKCVHRILCSSPITHECSAVRGGVHAVVIAKGGDLAVLDSIMDGVQRGTLFLR